jgi:hypothetical protein
VTLPSAGGTDDAIVKQIGPIAGMDTTLVASGTGESHTTGQIDDSNNTANSTSLARVEKLDVLANSSVPGGELIEARVVESACESSATSSGSASSGNAEILGLKIAGNNVCTGLMIDPACTPEPNTDLPLLPMGTLLRLNEQYCDGGTPTPAVTPSCTGPNASGITVNAIHIFIVGENNPLGLPVGADVVISHAHCDTKKVP